MVAPARQACPIPLTGFAMGSGFRVKAGSLLFAGRQICFPIVSVSLAKSKRCLQARLQ
jgi:hypothetical protein